MLHCATTSSWYGVTLEVQPYSVIGKEPTRVHTRRLLCFKKSRISCLTELALSVLIRSGFGKADISRAFEYFELKEQNCNGIDLAYPGPHYLFLPFGPDRIFIDYAWLDRRLYDLFLGMNIPDQNFK